MKPTFGSAFAGIGGFEIGLERAGWECRWQIENDTFCNRILGTHWPDVKRYGDIEEIDPKELEAVDLICGGFPCQDLSVAGKREGLSGERSGLFWELVRLVRELQPRWLLIENVPGFLSSNEGNDFALALETLAECGYGLAWRVLDSQYFGVPQRRRRVFIVGHLGTMCPPEILFESEGGEGDIAEGGKAGEDIAYCLSERPKRGIERSRETLITYKKRGGFGWSEDEDRTGSLEHEGGSHQGGPERIPYIIHPDGLGHRENEDTRGGGEGTNLGRERREGRPEDSPHRLCHNKGQDFDLREYEAISPAVTERWGTGGCNVPYVEGVRPRVARSALGRLGKGDDGEEAGPNGVRETSGVPRRVDLFVSENQRAELRLTPYARQLTTGGGKPGQGYPAVLTEQNEGFACPCPDSPRYRALGNAVTVQVAEWIGRRILEYD